MRKNSFSIVLISLLVLFVAASESRAQVRPVSPQTMTLYCYATGRSTGVYLSDIFTIPASDYPSATAAFKDYIATKYSVTGNAVCPTGATLELTKQNLQQATTAYQRRNLTVIQTGWVFDPSMAKANPNPDNRPPASAPAAQQASATTANAPSSAAPAPGVPARSATPPAAAPPPAGRTRPTNPPASPPSAQPALGNLTGDQYAKQGDDFYDAGEYEKSIDAYRKALALTTDAKAASAFHLMIGRSFVGLDRYKDAAPAFQEAIRLNSREPDAYFGAGFALALQDKCEEAVSMYTEGLRIQSEPSRHHYFLGFCYRRLKKYDLAIASINRFLSVKPNDSDALYELASSQRELKNVDEALKNYRAAVQADSQHEPAHYRIGEILNERKQYREAASELQQAVRLDPEDVDARSELGYAYRGLKQYSDAISELKRAIALVPDDPIAHYYLGLTYVDSGSKDAALGEYNTLRKLDEMDAADLLEAINEMGKPVASSAAATNNSQPKPAPTAAPATATARTPSAAPANAPGQRPTAAPAAAPSNAGTPARPPAPTASTPAPAGPGVLTWRQTTRKDALTDEVLNETTAQTVVGDSRTPTTVTAKTRCTTSGFAVILAVSDAVHNTSQPPFSWANKEGRSYIPMRVRLDSGTARQTLSYADTDGSGAGTTEYVNAPVVFFYDLRATQASAEDALRTGLPAFDNAFQGLARLASETTVQQVQEESAGTLTEFLNASNIRVEIPLIDGQKPIVDLNPKDRILQGLASQCIARLGGR